MEYVPGPTLTDIDLDKRTGIIPRMAQIIAHFGQIHGGQVPGPIGGGYPESYLWGDDGASIMFTSVPVLNDYLNKRLTLRNESIDLTGHPLVLCHLDLGRRNVVLGDDDTISIFNWNDAGLYPRFFEITTISCLNPWFTPYDNPLEEVTTTLLGLTEEEKRLMDLLRVVRSFNLRQQLREPFLF